MFDIVTCQLSLSQFSGPYKLLYCSHKFGIGFFISIFFFQGSGDREEREYKAKAKEIEKNYLC